MSSQTQPAPVPGPLSDGDLVAAVVRRDPAAFETLMRRYNGRLFRVARSILRDDRDAEDAVQDAYLDAFRHMSTFRGDAALGTWLTRIVANQSLMRLRRRTRERRVLPFRAAGASLAHDSGQEADAVPDTRAETASDAVLRAELRTLIERRIDELPIAFRTVFVMREVEEMTVQETADTLALPPATVRTRLFRARGLLREALARDLDPSTLNVFGFAGVRCDRLIAVVLARWTALPDLEPPA